MALVEQLRGDTERVFVPRFYIIAECLYLRLISVIKNLSLCEYANANNVFNIYFAIDARTMLKNIDKSCEIQLLPDP